MQEWFLLLLPAFLLGLLHTAIPCEDKAIFCFWSFGISKDSKQSVFILFLYGLGIFTANMVIGTIMVIAISIPRLVFNFHPDPYITNFFGALSSLLVAIIFLFFIARRDYEPHSRYKEEILNLNWQKKKTPYLFGVLAGFPPCIFELYIYTQCFSLSFSYGWIEALLTVFYFALGTFLGLFIFALAKQGTDQLMGQVEEGDEDALRSKRRRIFFIMLFIIIFFNILIMILSFLRLDIVNVQPLPRM